MLVVRDDRQCARYRVHCSGAAQAPVSALPLRGPATCGLCAFLAAPVPAGAPAPGPAGGGATAAPTEGELCKGAPCGGLMQNPPTCTNECKAWICDRSKSGACIDWEVRTGLFSQQAVDAGQALCGCAGGGPGGGPASPAPVATPSRTPSPRPSRWPTAPKVDVVPASPAPGDGGGGGGGGGNGGEPMLPLSVGGVVAAVFGFACTLWLWRRCCRGRLGGGGGGGGGKPSRYGHTILREDTEDDYHDDDGLGNGGGIEMARRPSAYRDDGPAEDPADADDFDFDEAQAYLGSDASDDDERAAKGYTHEGLAWTEDEDLRLAQGVAAQADADGSFHWGVLSLELPRHTPQECRERWEAMEAMVEAAERKAERKAENNGGQRKKKKKKRSRKKKKLRGGAPSVGFKRSGGGGGGALTQI